MLFYYKSYKYYFLSTRQNMTKKSLKYSKLPSLSSKKYAIASKISPTNVEKYTIRGCTTKHQTSKEANEN